MTRTSTSAIAKVAALESRIYVIRGAQVMLDADLAGAYGVATRALNQAVRRNRRRFPSDFAFQLTTRESVILRSQTVISRSAHGGRRHRPWVFTEHGAIMVASVLNSARAVQMSMFVVRAFVRLRDVARTHAELASKLSALERRVTGHDGDIEEMFTALRRLVAPPVTKRPAIGFRTR